MSETRLTSETCPECDGIVYEREMTLNYASGKTKEREWMWCIECGWDNK